MTKIVINDLNLPGFYLLSSEESYLNEINDNELDLTRGGLLPLIIAFGAGGTASVIARKIHDYNRGIIARL